MSIEEIYIQLTLGVFCSCLVSLLGWVESARDVEGEGGTLVDGGFP